MDWRDVTSSAIARVAYDETASILSVEFESGTIYEYFNVPRNVYEALLKAESAGGYFAQNIRDVYRFDRTR